jgi:hypothetical protein
MLVSRTATHQQEIRRNKMRKHATLLGAVLLAFVSALSYAQAPVPFINLPLMPDATAPGGPQFTLTLNGTGFVSTSVVNWNGSALATQFVSQSQLTATVPAANIATASTGWVTVVNPAPGGGTSNTAFFTVMAETKYVAFNLSSSPATGFNPLSVAVGDFNGDGRLDLAVANMCGSDPTCNSAGSVSVFLGDGAGNFTLASSSATGISTTAVAVGDFNGDGKLDLAVTSCTVAHCSSVAPGEVSILLGDGTGNFTLASSPATDRWPNSVVVGDFNRDGKLDLASANDGAETASILLGDGTGNFTLASSPYDGPDPWSLAAGDFNGDGNLDLAVVDFAGNNVSILLGDGAGNFTLASSPAVGIEPLAVAVGDFNGDGKLDLAVTNQCGSDPTCQSVGTVSILLGDGAGNFTLASSPAVEAGPISVAAGDFNGDGKLDLAVANESGIVSILIGDGTGNFTAASSVTAGGQPYSIAVGDFNGDGKLDLAVANDGSKTVSILLQVPAVSAVTLSPTSLTFGMQLVGTSSNPQPVTLTNTGSLVLKISKIAARWNFSQTNNCPSSLAPNGQCTINVTFKPNRVGRLSGAITISDNASNSPQTVPLTGRRYRGDFVALEFELRRPVKWEPPASRRWPHSQTTAHRP